MKKNEELKHRKEKVKLKKINYIVIITPIVLTIVLIAIIAYYVFIYSNPSNQLKRLLIDENYICNKEVCFKIINEENHFIDYKDGIISITTQDYSISINKNQVSLDSQENELVCTYTNDNYLMLKNITEKDIVSNSKKCKEYINTVNKEINYYQKVFESYKFDINLIK